MSPKKAAADSLPAYEKLGAFYLGRSYDQDTGQTTDETVLYDAKDLTTHAICVGMTGSGKTGLCISMIEEAAIDGIPVLAIDVKGDMGNLLLHFPDLLPHEFEPWIDPGEAAREGRSVKEHAEFTANLWKKGLAKWDQSPERIARMRDAADFAIYTPGSSAGLGLTVLRSFAAPPQDIIDDREIFTERIQSAAAGLLAMLGIDADPVQSREMILLSAILDHHWREGNDLSVADLIRQVQAPPFKQLGVLDLDTFFGAKERMSLAMSLNGLIASPSFASWLEGEPLDIQRLLFTTEGKPRVSVISIAHMSDSERMFFVTILLGEMLAWMRQQQGTGSLRAMLYMDEIFGYFPPSANPPSKKPMLTLLKQARAFGVGIVLATQNPVDLDYKGLSNTGTWMIGRLQTERDKLRVLDGLEGALSSGGKDYDRGELDRLLSGLGKRVFLLHNVHEDRPVVFHTRWAMNYLSGPLDRGGVERLMKERKALVASEASTEAPASNGEAKAAAPARPTAAVKTERPALPADVDEGFQTPSDDWDGEAALLYRPHFGCIAHLHYANASAGVDRWTALTIRAPLVEDEDVPLFDEASIEPGEKAHKTRKRPEKGHDFEALPSAAQRAKSYTSWGRELEQFLYRTRPMTLYKNKEFKLVSEPGEAEGDFRARVAQAAREKRDIDLEKLKAKYKKKLDRLEESVRKAAAKVDSEEDQLAQKKKDRWISMGTSLIGSIFGRKSSSVSRAGTAARSQGRVSKEKGDVQRAKDTLAAKQEEFEELNREFEEAIAEMSAARGPADFELTEVVIRPRKSDSETEDEMLVWMPTEA